MDCVISSDGRQERVMFDKITSRIQKLCYGLNMDFVDPVSKYRLYLGFLASCDSFYLFLVPGLSFTSYIFWFGILLMVLGFSVNTLLKLFVCKFWFWALNSFQKTEK